MGREREVWDARFLESASSLERRPLIATSSAHAMAIHLFTTSEVTESLARRRGERCVVRIDGGKKEQEDAI